MAIARHLLANGSHGLVVAGTTGEAATLTDDEQVRLVELIAGEAGARGRDRRRRRLQRHAPRDRADRARDRRGRRGRPLGHAVLQQAEPARDRAPLRGGRPRGRRARRSCSTTSPAAPRSTWGPTCSPSWRRSTASSASSRPTRAELQPIDGLAVLAGNDDGLRSPAWSMGGAGVHLRRLAHRRPRDAPHVRRARAPRGDRRVAARRLRDALHHRQPDAGQGRAEPARPRRRHAAAADGRGRRGRDRGRPRDARAPRAALRGARTA